MRRGHLIVSAVATALLVAGAGGAGAQDTPPDLTVLQAAFDAAVAGGDHAAALAAGAPLAEALEERHVDALTRMARLHAQLGHLREACDLLAQASAAGYLDVYSLRKDPAFDPLRQDERFRTILRTAWVKGYLAMLERPGRDDFQKPDQVMAALALKPGERVADIGAGSGYFTRRVARAVGPEGVVWAVDLVQEFLDHIAAAAAEEGLTNVRTLKVEADDPQLPAAGVDTVLLVDTLHYVKAPERPAYARKLRSGLAPGGRVVVVDYYPKTFEERPWGPPPEQNMSREEVDAAMAEAGLVPVASHNFLPEQFFVEYRVAPEPAAS